MSEPLLGVKPPYVEVFVGAMLEFHTKDLPPKIVEKLRFFLSFPNPEWRSAKMMGRSTDGINEKIDVVKEADGWVEIPRGCVELLKDACQSAGYGVKFQDARAEGEPLKQLATNSLPPRPYQADAVEKVVKGQQGSVIVPCGGGKSLIGAMAIAELKCSAIILVHTEDLLDQWMGLLTFMGLNPVAYFGGKRTKGQITVAMVQSLDRMSARAWDEFDPQRFGVCLIDESHHTPATTWLGIISRIPAKHRIALTATPEREDELTPLMDYSVGRRLYEISIEELVDGGYLLAPEIRVVDTSFHYSLVSVRNLPRCLKALTQDEERNKQIVTLVSRSLDGGNHSVLVLTGRKEHCYKLGGLLHDAGIDARVVVSTTNKGVRKEIIERFRTGAVRVVVASTLADEGLDVPRVDRLILAFPWRAKGRAVQRAGRIMRPFPGKKTPLLFDMRDSNIPLLVSQASERNEVWKRLVAARQTKLFAS